jgi:copper chaperone CopZ
MTTNTTDLQETSVIVTGLNCSGCVGTLTRKALEVDGVVQVDVDLDPGQDSRVVLRHTTRMDGRQVADALTGLGYRVTFPVPA